MSNDPADDSAPDISPDGTHVADASVLVLLNAWWEELDHTLPDGSWSLLLDTADPDAAEGARTYEGGERVPAAGRSLVVLERST